jgi:hypothetical protein
MEKYLRIRNPREDEQDLIDDLVWLVNLMIKEESIHENI